MREQTGFTRLSERELDAAIREIRSFRRRAYRFAVAAGAVSFHAASPVVLGPCYHAPSGWLTFDHGCLTWG